MSNLDFIEEILIAKYPNCIDEMLSSLLINYVYRKTRSVAKSSKSRGNFANLYAIYVLVEDYISFKNHSSNDYTDYEGMQFTRAFNRQRQLPFGSKLQNHALNQRCNEEFLKFYPKSEFGAPIIRDKITNRYWINEKLLLVDCNNHKINISDLIIQIIDRYIELKRVDFQSFFELLESNIKSADFVKSSEIVRSQLDPEVDARIFEIVSYAILKYLYIDQIVYYGSQISNIQSHVLNLYKTGRTNSNDGGIDFILLPTGKVYQVTEVLDFKKYFLDIDKVNRYPINFVVKTTDKPETVMRHIKQEAEQIYKDKDILDRYLNAFESVITIPTLEQYLHHIIESRHLAELINEIILQCKVEFNIPID